MNSGGRERTCLRCGELFPSTGSGNRVCKKCLRRKLGGTRSGHGNMSAALRRGLKKQAEKLTGKPEAWKANIKRMGEQARRKPK